MRYSHGFTIIELVMTLILITIMAAALIPRGPSNKESVTLTGRAQQLASDVRYAQTLSMTSGARHCLSLTPAAGPPYSGYQLTTAASGCVTPVEHPGGLIQPIPLCDGSTCITAPVLTNDYVQFDGLGAPYLAAATALPAAGATITLSDAGGSKTLTISQTTGRVIVP